MQNGLILKTNSKKYGNTLPQYNFVTVQYTVFIRVVVIKRNLILKKDLIIIVSYQTNTFSAQYLIYKGFMCRLSSLVNSLYLILYKILLTAFSKLTRAFFSIFISSTLIFFKSYASLRKKEIIF